MPALVSLKGITSFYDDTTSQSVIDDGKYRNYLSLTWKFNELLKRLIVLNQSKLGECLNEQLMEWATNGALLGGVEQTPGVQRRQAIMLQAWTVVATTSAIAYERRSQGPQVDPRVVKWISQLGWSVFDEFREQKDRPEWLNQSNNHLYWGGLAQVRAGLLADNPKLIDFGLSALRRAHSEVADDGTLPIEMRRGSRAVHYHNFALLPLAGLIEAAQDAGQSIDDDRWQRVALLARTTLGFTLQADAFRGNGTGKQKLGPAMEELAWVPIIYELARERDPKFAQWLKQTMQSLPPLLNRFYGCSANPGYDTCH